MKLVIKGKLDTRTIEHVVSVTIMPDIDMNIDVTVDYVDAKNPRKGLVVNETRKESYSRMEQLRDGQ